MEISCTGFLFWGGLLSLLISFFVESKNEGTWRWLGGVCLLIWAVIQICGIVWAVSLWNSYESSFEVAPDANDCPSGIVTYVDGDWVCKTSPTPITVRTESSWQFFDLEIAEDMINLAYEDSAYGETTPITITCTGDNRAWATTMGGFLTELNVDDGTIFGVPRSEFCPAGGQFVTNS